MEDLAEIRKVLKENPHDPGALRGAAKYYLNENYFKRACDQYIQAVNLSPFLLTEVLLDYEKKIESEPGSVGTRLSLARFLLAEGAVDSALLELEEILEVDPQNVEAYNVLGRIYIKQDKIDEAIALLERSIAAGVKDVNLTETLAWAYLEKGRISEAIKFYEEILAQKPGDKQTLRILGELYTRTEEYNQAARHYQAMFSEDPEVAREVIQRLEDLLKKVEGSVDIREILADIYMKALNPDAAVEKLKDIMRLESTKLEDTIQKLRSILKSYPLHPPAVLVLAEALRRQGNFSEAVENYYQLVKVKPEFMDEVIRGYREVLDFCPEQLLARSYLGEALLYQNKIEEALSEFGKMVEADGTTAETVIRRCREIMKAYPQLLQPHIVLGQAYLAKGDFQRAAAEAEGIISIDKKITSAYLLLGEAYAKLKLGRRASETLHTALMLDGYNLQIHEKYREVKVREIDSEIERLKERLQEDQWKISLHLDLAELYLAKSEREKAVRELQLAQKDTARASLAFNLLGNIYRSEGRCDLAAAQYNRALESASPEISKTIRFNLGTTYEAQGQVRKAIKIYESILQEDIDFGGLDKRVKRLKMTSLQSMRSHLLQAVIFEYSKRDLMALWGWEARSGNRGGRREEVSVSFGQEHNQEGFDYFMKGMYQAAEEEFSLATQLDRRFAPALNNFGIALAKAGRLEEARLRLAEAAEIDPASAVHYNNLGAINFLLGKLDLAKVALEKSYALDPESAAVCLNLGDLYYLKKDLQKAIELYRKIGAFDPLSDIAKQRLLYKVP